MKKVIREIIFRLLCLTPIGYLLSFIELQDKNKTRGIVLSMSRNEPTHIEVKRNSSLGDRAYWFFNGVVLMVQAWLIFHSPLIKRSDSSFYDLAGAYAVFAAIFGLASAVSAFYPKLPWNKKLF